MKQQRLAPDTQVWTADMPDWAKASEVPGLRDIVCEPPPFKDFATPPVYLQPKPVSSASERIGYYIGRQLRAFLVVVLLAVIGIVVYTATGGYRFSADAAEAPTEKTPEQLREELAAREAQNPAQYLLSDSKMRGNLLGTESDYWNGNQPGKHSTFKDIIIRVEFYSQTGTSIGSHDFTLYEVLSPAATKPFKFKAFAPEGTNGFNAVVVGATSIN